MYRILVRGKAAKQIQQISSSHFQRVQASINRLAENPRPAGVKKLKDDVGYRLRAGDYRILFEIDDSTQTVIIYRVKHRREVYR